MNFKGYIRPDGGVGIRKRGGFLVMDMGGVRQ